MKGRENIKEAIQHWILNAWKPQEDHVLISEMCFRDKKNRADIVYANGSLAAFEIKSGADTLLRWPHQMDAYLAVFDEVWLCVHGKHVQKALSVTVAAVGVVVADELGGVAMIRPAARNTGVLAYDLLGLLWRAELDELCRTQSVPVLRREKIESARRRAGDCIPLDTIRQHVLMCVKSRYACKGVHSSPSSSKRVSSVPLEMGNPTDLK